MIEWKRAKNSIPGGNCFYSKRPFKGSPTYFSKAKGCNLWDLKGRKYIDMATMGIGTAILGYCDPDVDGAVKKAIDKGINTSLNCPEEVLLAEELLKLNPFASKVKFARTGNEAIQIAIRLAQDYTGKKKIAYNGYHGWLLKNSPISFNKPWELLRVRDLGVIIVELAREDYVSQEFLMELEEVAKKKKCVIIADEITSGFRATLGGVYKTLDFTPDIVVYGKALGNGYAITAIVGKEGVMKERSFISSTFFSERIGFVAALATIKKFKKEKVWEHIDKMGRLIHEGWIGLGLEPTVFRPLIGCGKDYSKEMIKKGFLCDTNVFISYAHKEEHINKYLKALEKVV